MVSPSDEVATPCETTNAQDKASPKKGAAAEDLKAAAFAALGAGKRHLLVQDVDAAVESFGEACELFSAQFGENAVECGEAYLYYGKALLEQARLETDALGGPMVGEGGDKSEEEDGDEDTETADNSTECELPKGDAEGEAEGEEAAEGEDDDEPNNLQLAWQMLELAKLVYTKQVSEGSPETKLEAERKLCDTLLTLGEVSLENEDYVHAEEDLLNCLQIQVDSLPADSRDIAETHYQLGVTQGFAMKFEEAMKSLNAAITVLDTRVNNQKNKADTLDEATKKEILDLESLIPEIKEKIVDTKEMKNSYLNELRAKVGLPTSAGESSSSFGGTSSSEGGSGAKPISSIAIKRKTAEEPVDPKKPKDN